MDKIEIYSSKKKSLLLFVGSMVFVVLGIYMLRDTGNFSDHGIKNPILMKGVAIASILLFGMGIYVSLRQLIKNKLMLVIDNEGLHINPGASSSTFISWKYITGFSEAKIHSARFIIIELSNSDYWMKKEKNKIRKKFMKFNIDNYGSPFNLSAQTMKVNHSQLMDMLHKNLEKYRLSQIPLSDLKP